MLIGCVNVYRPLSSWARFIMTPPLEAQDRKRKIMSHTLGIGVYFGQRALLYFILFE